MKDLRGHALGLVAALGGAAIGHYGVLWMYRQGFYGVMLPGVLIGFGGGFFLRHRSWPMGVACGLGALAAGLHSHWTLYRFSADPSFGYLVRHFGDLKGTTQLMIVAGAAFGCWMGMGRERYRYLPPPPPPNPPPPDGST